VRGGREPWRTTGKSKTLGASFVLVLKKCQSGQRDGDRGHFVHQGGGFRCARRRVGHRRYIIRLPVEAVEEMSIQQVEAVRATGPSFLSVIIMSVLSQVMPR